MIIRISPYLNVLVPCTMHDNMLSQLVVGNQNSHYVSIITYNCCPHFYSHAIYLSILVIQTLHGSSPLVLPCEPMTSKDFLTCISCFYVFLEQKHVQSCFFKFDACHQTCYQKNAAKKMLPLHLQIIIIRRIICTFCLQ
jgi:hypothetical protein